ncbi:MAG: hypothetical protein ACYS99_02035 [Planctomycetota bacterium]|jgi:hypothetical protein
MSCEEIRDRIAVASATGAPLEDEVRLHLEACEACRAEAGPLREAASVLRAAHLLMDGRERRAPLFAGTRRRRVLWPLAAIAAAAATLVALLHTPETSRAPAPEPAPVLAYRGDARIERLSPDRLSLLEGAAEIVSTGPFVVDTPVAAIRGEVPCEFSVAVEREVSEVSPRVRGLAGGAVVVAVALVVSVQSGWLTVEPDEAPPVRVNEGEEKRIVVPTEGPTVTTPPGAEPPALPPSAGPDAGEPGACHGRLVWEDAEPVAGEWVWVRSSPDLAARTDDAGRFRIEGLPVPKFPQSLMLGPRGAATAVGAVRLRSGEDVEVDVTVPRGVDLEIVVRGPGGSGLPKVLVDLQPAVRSSGAARAMGVTAKDGRLTLRWLRRAAYRVAVNVKGRRPYRGEIDLSAGPLAGPFVVDLVAAQRLTVRISNWTEGRTAKAFLVLRPVEAKARGPSFTIREDMRSDGSLVADAPPPGRYHGYLKVAGWMTSVEPFEVPEQGPVEIALTMPEGVEVSGWVLRSDGKPVTSGTIHLLPRSLTPGSPSVAISEGGSFTLVQVPPGRYEVSVSREPKKHAAATPFSQGGQTHRRFTDDIEVGPAGLTGLRIVLPAGGTIDGRMTGERPTLIQMIRLSLWTADGWEDRGNVTAKQDGTFRAEHLPPGRWRLSGSTLITKDRVADPVEVEIRGEETVTGVEIVWRRAAGIEVELRTPSGAPFTEDVTGLISPAKGGGAPRILRLEPDDAGRARLPALAPGKWELQILGGPQKLLVKEIEVVEGADRPITVVLWD